MLHCSEAFLQMTGDETGKRGANQSLSDQELKACRHQLAQYIAEEGEKYLPLFKRINNEFEARKRDCRALSFALKLARESRTI